MPDPATLSVSLPRPPKAAQRVAPRRRALSNAALFGLLAALLSAVLTALLLGGAG